MAQPTSASPHRNHTHCAHNPHARRTVVIILLSLIACGSAARAQRMHCFPLAGAVTDTSATVALWLDAPGAVSVRYSADSTFTGARTTPPAQTDASTDNTARIVLGGLLPSTRYYYRAEDAGGNTISRTQSFRTFPSAGADAPVSILFGSCQRDQAGDTGPLFATAAALGGDVFVQMGDWTYPDNLVPGYPAAAGSIRRSYEMRLDTAYPFARDVLGVMPVAYAWDDHDYLGNNSSAGSAPDTVKRALLEAYQRYIPHYGLANGAAGIWHSFTIGNAEVFVIDDRSQRNPADSAFVGNTFAPKPGHSMLAGYPVSGVDQRTWLLQAIRGSKARWKILASPVFFNPAAGPAIQLMLIANRKDYALEFADKWAGYPADVDSMKAVISEGAARNMLVICGDAHSNVYDNGEHSLVPEFMAGALDHAVSDVFEKMKGFGLNIWTELQPGTSPAVGRIRIETAPRHRLIVESFDTAGTRLLQFEMLDATSDVGGAGSDGALAIGSALVHGNRLVIALAGTPPAQATITIAAVTGATVRHGMVAPTNGTIDVAVADLPSGMYVGTLANGTRCLRFRFAVMR